MIGIIGPEFFGKRIESALQAKNMGAKFILESSKNSSKIRKELDGCTIIHFVTSPTINFLDYILFLRCKFLRKKVLINWIGWDVRKITNNWFWRIVTKLSQFMINSNIATSENLVEDLQKIGICCKYQPIPVYTLYPLKEFSKENRVAVYLPDHNPYEWSFYQGEIIKKLVKVFPEVEFLITRNSGKNFDEKNVKCFEWVEDMEDIYSKVKAVIRLPLHDGTSGTIIETFSMGRSMIASNTNVPFCKIVNNFEDAKKHLHDVLKEDFNKREASEYIHKNFNSPKLADELISIYNSL